MREKKSIYQNHKTKSVERYKEKKVAKAKIINSMEELVKTAEDRLIPFREREMTEAIVLAVSKKRIMVDLGGYMLGIVPEREFSVDSDEIKPGDKISAYVMMLENENGYAILSLRRADKEKLWDAIESKVANDELVSVRVVQANRGGLMAAFGNLEGFLPVSQLSSTHYPRVEGADKDKILTKLQQLVGKNLKVKILSFEKSAEKLIFSEKAAGDIELSEKLQSFKIGDKVKGKVTGVVSFGLFVDLGEIEGLVHISEISWDHIENIEDKFRVSDNIEAVVTSIENGRISLSVKQLTPDPWEDEAKKIKLGDKVKGEITTITPYGAFVKLPNGLEGLLHVSEFPDEALEGKQALSEGQEHQFEVIAIETASRKIALSLKQKNTKK